MTDLLLEEAKKLYEGKHFYKIIDFAGGKHLIGPFDNIYYISNYSEGDAFKFVQITLGQPDVNITEKEILVTDRIL